MSGNRDTIASACEAAAILGFARSLAAARERLNERARGGAEAVARAACPNGTEEERAQVAAHCERLLQRTSKSGAA